MLRPDSNIEAHAVEIPPRARTSHVVFHDANELLSSPHATSSEPCTAPSQSNNSVSRERASCVIVVVVRFQTVMTDPSPPHGIAPLRAWLRPPSPAHLEL
jgi:hypothetical protein